MRWKDKREDNKDRVRAGDRAVGEGRPGQGKRGVSEVGEPVLEVQCPGIQGRVPSCRLWSTVLPASNCSAILQQHLLVFACLVAF